MARISKNNSVLKVYIYTASVRQIILFQGHSDLLYGIVRYNSECPRGASHIVVYQANCVVTGMKYIGNTQQQVKSRMQQHKQDTKRLFSEGKKSDSFASHFAKLIPEGTTAKDVCGKNLIKYKVDILWQGNPLACVKTFGTSACKLCAKERLAILKITRKTPHLAINKCTEIYGACRHKPAFHRFDHNEDNKHKVSTDEARNAERVTQRLSPLSVTHLYHTTTNDHRAFAQTSDTGGTIVDGVWNELNPPEDEPPITGIGDIRISFMTHERERLLARSRLIQDKESIAPRTYSWIRDADGEPAGDFLTTEEATTGKFDMLESGPTWI